MNTATDHQNKGQSPVCEQADDPIATDIKEAWQKFLADRDFAVIHSTVSKYSSIALPLEHKETEGWLHFTRAAACRITNGYSNREWIDIALLAAECGNVIAMDWLVTAYVNFDNSFASKEIIKQYAANVVLSPFSAAAFNLANNILWASSSSQHQGVFDEAMLEAANKITASPVKKSRWRIGDFELNPVCISKACLTEIRDSLIDGWKFNITNPASANRSYCRLINLDQGVRTSFNCFLSITADRGRLRVETQSEIGNTLLCNWSRQSTEPIALINNVVEWIDALPQDVWPLMHLALYPASRTTLVADSIVANILSQAKSC